MIELIYAEALSVLNYSPTRAQAQVEVIASSVLGGDGLCGLLVSVCVVSNSSKQPKTEY